MTNIIATAAIVITNLFPTNFTEFEISGNAYSNYIHFNTNWPTQKMFLDISNCPVVSMGSYSFPRLTDKQWDILTNYYKMTNMNIQFYAPLDKK